MARSRGGRGLGVVIPAAGDGRRMRMDGSRSTIEIAPGEPLIGLQVRLVRAAYPESDIVAVVGYDAGRVVAALPRGVRVVENERHAETGVLRSVGLGLRVLDRAGILVLNGDLVFGRSAISGPSRGTSNVIVEGSGQINADEVGVNVAGGNAVHFAFGLPVKWAQIAYLSGVELELFRGFASDPGWRNRQVFEALNGVADLGGRLRAVSPRGLEIAEIDTPKDIERLRRKGGAP